ncbi:MAG: ATP-binding cassette domain-containing protein [Phycisphaerae bacterium]|nr:ATP-binding cassette domain-containing protein [Phycisphaerae bacterium]
MPAIDRNSACAPAPAPAGADIIQVKDASIGYGNKVVQKNLTFAIRRGEIFIVGGGSGSGKSTLLDTFIGLNAALGGSIEVDGVQIVGADEACMNKLRTRFGVSYQGGALWGGQTVLENVMLPLQTYTDLPRPLVHAAALGKLALVGLADSGDLLPSEISGGMRKRAAIARALALDPMLVFLDEPSAGLDPITAGDLDELLRTLNASLGTTFVVVTHELPSIFNIGHRVLLLDRDAGTMVAIGTPQELKNSKEPFVQAFMNRETTAELAKARESHPEPRR